MIVQIVARFYFRLVTYSFVTFNRSKKILVLDIDNTIAHTYESLNQKNHLGRRDRLLGLKPKYAVIKFVTCNYPDHRIFFLSARSLRDFPVTISWLKIVGYKMSWLNLVLVPSPLEKTVYLQILSRRNNVIYIDDLSYNHENGEVKFYVDVILKVQELGLTYLGYKEIKLLEEATYVD